MCSRIFNRETKKKREKRRQTELEVSFYRRHCRSLDFLDHLPPHQAGQIIRPRLDAQKKTRPLTSRPVGEESNAIQNST